MRLAGRKKTERRMHVAIFQVDMGIGGIQRSLLTLLSGGALGNCDVDLYLFDKNADFDIEVLPENVRIRYLKPMRHISRAVPFDLLAQKSHMQELENLDPYDLSIDFNGYSPDCAIGALSVPSRHTAIWVHSDYAARSRYDKKFAVMFAMMRGKYQHFDCIVAVSPGVADSIIQLTGCEESKVRIVPNLINESEIIEMSREAVEFSPDPDKVNIIYAGRFDFIKGIEELIKSADSAIDGGANLDLYLMGKGSFEKRMRKLIRDAHNPERIKIISAQNNPYPYIAAMDGLVLNSFYEGQGIVLMEAQVLGVKPIFPKRLEKYNPGLTGVDSVKRTLMGMKKKTHGPNGHSIDEYSLTANRSIAALLDWASR